MKIELHELKHDDYTSKNSCCLLLIPVLQHLFVKQRLKTFWHSAPPQPVQLHLFGETTAPLRPERGCRVFTIEEGLSG